MRRISLRGAGLVAAVLSVGVLFGCENTDIIGLRPRDFPRTVHVVEVSGTALPLTIDPDPVTVRRGDQIRWVHTGSVDSLKIDLGRVPAAPSLPAVASADTAVAAIAIGAPFGTFKYSVTVVAGGQSVTEDPQVVVEEEEEPGEGG
jgi:hypothetical protein